MSRCIECPETGETCFDTSCSIRHCKETAKRKTAEASAILAARSRVEEENASRETAKAKAAAKKEATRLGWEKVGAIVGTPDQMEGARVLARPSIFKL